MDAKMHLCASLIDRLDDIFASVHTGSSGQRPVVSRNKTAGLLDTNQQSVKNQLLTEMQERFIDRGTFSIRLSDLLLFCSGAGFELVTQYTRKSERASFFLRTHSFDLIVELTS